MQGDMYTKKDKERAYGTQPHELCDPSVQPWQAKKGHSCQHSHVTPRITKFGQSTSSLDPIIFLI
jgi:hypothetical protein